MRRLTDLCSAGFLLEFLDAEQSCCMKSMSPNMANLSNWFHENLKVLSQPFHSKWSSNINTVRKASIWDSRRKFHVLNLDSTINVIRPNWDILKLKILSPTSQFRGRDKNEVFLCLQVSFHCKFKRRITQFCCIHSFIFT